MPAKSEPREKIADLRSSLEDIKTRKGVIGYILRDPRSASVDINDPSKIIDYAILSSTMLDSGETLLKIFELGELENIILEGENVKVLAIIISDYRLSIFMNKDVDHNSIYKDLNLK